MKFVEELRSLKGIVDELASTSSTREKEEILTKSLERNSHLLPYLQAVYDPMTQFYLTSETVKKRGKVRGLFGSKISKEDIEPLSLLARLRDRNLSGNDACNHWAALIHSLPEDLRPIADRILDKDLKCRVGVKILNKALARIKLPEIPEFSVALGEAWKGEEVWNREDELWFTSRKLDGIRCLAICQPDGSPPLLLSRTGKAFETLGKIAEALKGVAFEPCVLDGEIALETENGADDFQGVMKEIRRKDHTIQNPWYHIFDYIPLADFENGCSPLALVDRYERLDEFLMPLDSHAPISKVIQKSLDDDAVFSRMMRKADLRGWEGLILRKDAPYQGKRSKDILKVKKMQDLEAEVVDIVPGTMQVSTPQGEQKISTMSAAVIEYRGNRVQVGTGWSVEQRKAFLEDPDQIVGKIITVQYFEETRNQDGSYSLRFPVVKTIHGKEGRTV
jgi:DNA ligase-1